MVDKPTYEELEHKVKELEKSVSERKRGEGEAQVQAKWIRVLFSSIKDAIFVHPFKEEGFAPFTEVNDTACERYGYSREEFLHLTAPNITQKPEANAHSKHSHRSKLLEKGHLVFEAVHIKKSGETFPVEINSNIVYQFGKPFILAVVRDITERKQAEKKLRQSEEQMKLILSSIPDYILQIDKDMKITWANKAATKLNPDAVGQYCYKAYLNKNEPCFSCPVVKSLKTGNTEAGIIHHPKVQGVDGESWWNLVGIPLKHKKGEITGAIEFSRNITDNKLNEDRLRQSQKMESIGTLAGGVAHDFNNILGIILGNTELAMDDVPEWNPASLNLEEVKIATLRAKDVVRQLLSFARKTELERKPVKINPIVTEALKLLRSSIPSSIEIHSNITRDLAIVLADPTQINQIIINLCTNGAHAMEEDGGVLEISLGIMTLDESTARSHELSPGRYVKLTVRDTGHGINPEFKDRIFDPYFTTREIGKGSGIGLAVVHGIVKNHDGAITVDSEVGQGATFNVFIPIIRREPVPDIKIEEDLPTGNERILLVDDEESIVKVGHQRLERLGYKVEAAVSPIEALAQFRSRPDLFDLVIADFTMPKMTGDKLLIEILNIRPDIPVILCSGFSEKIDEKKAKEIGAADYIEKPFDKRDLAFKVRKVLDGK
jgi:PAS domain S-box-containing protein